MADALVVELNRRGYQLMFLPRTGLKPPELYNWARSRRRLVRRAHLSEYLPRGTNLSLSWSKGPDIEQRATSSKNLAAGLSFLTKALACIGIDGVPTLDLSFVGKTDLSFRFTGVTIASFEGMDRLLRQGLTLDAIPAEYVAEGELHVAYEYLYADALLLSRSDQRAFEHDVAASLNAYVNLGGKGKAELRSSTTLSFSSTSGERVAFASKFGQLQRRDSQWFFYPEEGKLGPEGQRRLQIPARGAVLDVDPGE
jgi:hypothetical protein